MSKSTRKSRFSLFVAAYPAGHNSPMTLFVCVTFVAAYPAGHDWNKRQLCIYAFVAAYPAGHNQHTKNNCIKSILKSEIQLNTITNQKKLLNLYFNSLLNT
jgi:hypothetical protein